MPVEDDDLEHLLQQALRERPKARRSSSIQKAQEAQSYTESLAKKALYRRLLADPLQDARRFVWWFSNEGALELSLDQWRSFIDDKIRKQEERSRKDLERDLRTAEKASGAASRPKKLAD